MIIITAGGKYTDVDALACAVSYQELLRLEGREAEVVFSGVLNHSVSPLAKEQDYNIQVELPQHVDGFVVVDVSDPEHIASFVDLQKVEKIYDHHHGFKDFWEKKIGHQNVEIEMIGACATLIWEEFKKKEKANEISQSSANLLSLGIVSNTFNLNSPLTSKRDTLALEELQDYIDLPSNWIEKYFRELEESVFGNTKVAITNDTKVQKVPQIEQPLVIGQIELWDGSNFIKDYTLYIQESFKQYNNQYWMINIPSIKEGKNYIYSENDTVKSLIESVTKCSFSENICVTDKLILRKEILRDLITLK